MLTFAVQGHRLEIKATGTVPAEESAAVFNTIRADPKVPLGCMLLLDVREHDQSSVAAHEVIPRIMRMAEMLGPKLGKVWAVVIDDQIEQLVKIRLVQHLIDGSVATITIFQDPDEARAWLDGVGRQNDNSRTHFGENDTRGRFGRGRFDTAD